MSFRKLGTLALLISVLGALGAASASASSEFTASATGSLEGKALNNPVFHFNGGTGECTTAKTTGTIDKTASTEQRVRIEYITCVAFGFFAAMSPIEYTFTTHTEGGTLVNTAHITNTFTITVAPFCSVTIGPQTLKAITFENSGANNVNATFNLTGIKYLSSGSVCGTSGSNGSVTGNIEYWRVGGGTVRFDS